VVGLGTTTGADHPWRQIWRWLAIGGTGVGVKTWIVLESGQNTHRLSIEWSRIQPEPDVWAEEALDRYLEILRGMHERDLTPFVCLHHFSNPMWLSEAGGWENESAATISKNMYAKWLKH
jgi:beta-glucosidase/6-phospho-beta-glucosidase/beta-galactosidase